jgi:hypothetical protein
LSCARDHDVVARLEPQGALALAAIGALALLRLDAARGLAHVVEHVVVLGIAQLCGQAG